MAEEQQQQRTPLPELREPMWLNNENSVIHLSQQQGNPYEISDRSILESNSNPSSEMVRDQTDSNIYRMREDATLVVSLVDGASFMPAHKPPEAYPVEMSQLVDHNDIQRKNHLGVEKSDERSDDINNPKDKIIEDHRESVSIPLDNSNSVHLADNKVTQLEPTAEGRESLDILENALFEINSDFFTNKGFDLGVPIDMLCTPDRPTELAVHQHHPDIERVVSDRHSSTLDGDSEPRSIIKGAPKSNLIDQKRQQATDDRAEESCQGHKSQNETDDRLRRLSLRLSMGASSINNFKQNELSVGSADEKSLTSGLKRDNITEIFQQELTTVVGNIGASSDAHDSSGLSEFIKSVSNKAHDSEDAEDSRVRNSECLNLKDDDQNLSATELNNLISKISVAHKSNCNYLKKLSGVIKKRQPIPLFPGVGSSQYCRFRAASSSMSSSGLGPSNSPTSSLLNGSAGSSASSLSAGSPINNNQSTASSPSLSPSSNPTGPSTSSQCSNTQPFSDGSSPQHCPNSISSMMKMVDEVQTVSSIKVSSPTSDITNCRPLSTEDQRISLWQEYALLINPSIKQVVEFAKQVPGFLALNQLDQLLLIKSGFFEIWLVTIAGMFNYNDQTLTFADGTFIDRDQLDFMFDKNFTTIAFNFSISFNQLCLDDTEIGLVSAIILLQPKRPGIRCTDDVATRQCSVMRALKTKLRQGSQNGSHDARYLNLIVQLKDLENINSIHMRYIDWLRSNWSMFRFPTLFSEIFDIPISSESSTSSTVSDSLGDEPLGQEIEETSGQSGSGKYCQIEIENVNKTDTQSRTKSRVALNDEQKTTSDRFQESHDKQNLPSSHFRDQMESDFFFDLANLQGADEGVDAADLNPTVDCLDAVDQ